MRLVVEKVPPFGRDFSVTVSVTDLGEMQGVDACGPAQVDGQAERKAGGLRVWGRVAGCIALDCSRCLCRFELAVDSRFDQTFSPVRVNEEAEEEIELATEDLAVRPLEGDTVDLVGLAREQLLLEVPLAPLCKDGCEGLCLSCGADLNQGTCGCNEPLDPRFAALKKLL